MVRFEAKAKDERQVSSPDSELEKVSFLHKNFFSQRSEAVIDLSCEETKN